MEKLCTKCNVVKSINEFNKRANSIDGTQYNCRYCQKKWRQNNPEYHNQYQKDKYANDINFRLAHNLRNRLRKALLKQVTRKNDTTEALLGISYSEFKNYIEFLMSDEMKWNNIELDHVRPLSSFDLKDIEQLKEASHYSNIQPLLAKDNRIRSNNYHEYDLVVQASRVYDYAYFSTIK